MEGERRRRVNPVILALAAGLVTSCGRPVPVESLPLPRATLAATGQRLGRTLSAGDLTTLARRGDRVLEALTPAERDALARGYLRFQVDAPVVVTVAAPRGSEPFWLADQGFAATDLRLGVTGGPWSVHRKTFAAGWIGLGVNGLDLARPAHYVVFLQTLDGKPVRPRTLEGGWWTVTTAREGVSLASGVDLPIEALAPALRGATLLQPAHDQRHSTPLARGRVWKTHVVSSRRPDQVAVAFGPDAARELVWSWRTEPGTGSSVVRYRSPGGAVREVEGTSRTVEVPELLNDPLVRRHSVRVGGLEPDTAYTYSVGDGNAGGMSPWNVVRTGPRRSADTHLIYLGDPQCGLERWGRMLADAIRRHPETGAILIAGDLVDRGNERSNWDHFFLRAAGVFERVPVMPAVGNHEYLDQGPRLYRALFALPANGPAGVDPGLVYSFEYGEAFVAVLDSTLAVSRPSEAARQAEWLDGQLARTDCRWKLVMFHHPLYASHTKRENLALRDAWLPVIDRHRVDLVLQGHDHAYLRTYPMRANRRVGSPAEGTVYVVSVSGDKFYDQDPRDYTECGLTFTSTYQTIDIIRGGSRLVYRARDASGAAVDALEIDKPAGVPDLAATERQPGWVRSGTSPAQGAPTGP